MSTDVNALVVVKPITITDAMIDTSGSPPATNVPENDYPAWSSGTTYAAGNRVILTSTHKIYESLLSGNIGNDPTVVSSPQYWIEVAPTNRWAAFDTSVSTSTVQANNITYTLEPGIAITALGVLNLQNATEITVTMVSPATGSPGIVYEKTVALGGLPNLPDWWSWFYGIRSPQTQALFTDLPAYTDCIITIEIIGGSSLSVGVILMGQKQAFGLGIKYGASVGIQDYSRKETNEFGDTVLVQRAFAKRANFDLFINADEVDLLQSTLSSLRATPCLWIGSNSYEATTIFGFYKNFDILISYPEHSDCQLEIEGLV
jgi:hypothetical protein